MSKIIKFISFMINSPWINRLFVSRILFKSFTIGFKTVHEHTWISKIPLDTTELHKKLVAHLTIAANVRCTFEQLSHLCARLSRPPINPLPDNRHSTVSPKSMLTILEGMSAKQIIVYMTLKFIYKLYCCTKLYEALASIITVQEVQK